MFFALAFTAATFAPVSNLLVPIGTIMAERLLYVPSIGFCLAAALALRGLAGVLPLRAGRRGWAFAGLVGAAVLLHGGRAYDRSLAWHSDARLWLHDLEMSPKSFKD